MLVKIGAVSLAAILGIGTPLPGQPSPESSDSPDVLPPVELVELTDFQPLRSVFEQHDGDVRLVALLSPTCGYCIKGYRYMRKLLEEIADPRLKMIVVWEPILSGDSREAAARQARRGEDPRIVYQAWDSENLTGKAWSRTMGIGSPAWDVYFLYGAEATWEADAPATPAYWQHQGAGERENWLDYDDLKAEIERLLAAAS